MKLNYSEPKIFTGGVDISKWYKLSKAEQRAALKKSWFIYYSYRNPKTGRLKKQPFIKAGANRLNTKKDRYRYLCAFRDALSEMLELGYNPYEANKDLDKLIRENQNIKDGKYAQPLKTLKERKFSSLQEKAQIQTKPKAKPTSKKQKTSFKPQPQESVQEVKPSNTKSDEYTIDKAVEFGLSMKEHMMSKNSYIQYKSRINLFKRWLEEHHDCSKPISTVGKAIVNEYLNDVLKRTSSRNRNNSRTDIASLFQLLEDNEIVTQNFVKSIPKLKSSPKRNKTYTPDQEEAIFKYLKKEDPLLLLYIQFISFNFLRPIEVCRLRIKDLDLKHNQLQVKAKNQPVKTKIIPKMLIDVLPDLSKMPADALLFGRFALGEDWAATEVNRRTEFSKRFKTVKDHFGLGKNFGLYSFRHTFITKLYRKLREKHDPFVCKSKLKLITGHATMNALEAYLREIDAELPEDYSDLLS